MPKELSVRIRKETKYLLDNLPPGVTVFVAPENPRLFAVFIDGPTESPYEGGLFRVNLELPDDYPMVPPKVHFVTKIYHPNVDLNGGADLCLLDRWSPALRIGLVITAIQELLACPNADDPLVPRVAEHWKSDPVGAVATAKQFTERYAK